MKRILTTLLLGLMLPTMAQADEAAGGAAGNTASAIPTTIRVDRPSFANSSNVVGLGVNSMECGVQVIVTKGDPQSLTQTPLLFRHGISERLEFRLGTSGLNFRDGQRGWADLAPGFKWNFHSDNNISVSLVGSITVPVGSTTLRAASVSPSLSFAVDLPVGSQTGLLVNVGANAPGEGSNRVLQPFATVGVSQTLSDKWAIYAEGAVFGPGSPGAPNTTAGDVVVTYLVNPDLQLDAAFFKGFSSGGLDWAATLGLSRRF